MRTIDELLQILAEKLKEKVEKINNEVFELAQKKELREIFANNKESIAGISQVEFLKKYDLKKIITFCKKYSLPNYTDEHLLILYKVILEKGEEEPDFKKYDRYEEAHRYVTNLQNSILSKATKTDHETALIDIKQEERRKFNVLLQFINGTNRNIELENLENYYLEDANFSKEEWLEIYNYLLKLQIEAYMQIEKKTREKKAELSEVFMSDRASVIDQQILESLPKEMADIIRTADEYTEVVLEEAPIMTPKVETNGRSEEYVVNVSINNPLILNMYKEIQQTLKKYYRYAKISGEKREVFKSIETDNNPLKVNLEENLYHGDINYYLYYYINEYLKSIYTEINTVRPPSEIPESEELTIELLNEVKEILDILVSRVDKDTKEREELNAPESVELERAYKVLFYENNGVTEIEKLFKSLTPEKMEELRRSIEKLEEGRFSQIKTIGKYTRINFKAIIGQYLYVLFRILPEGHLLVYTAGDIRELEKINTKLIGYDLDVEAEIDENIKSNSIKYKKTQKKASEIKEQLQNKSVKRGSKQ